MQTACGALGGVDVGVLNVGNAVVIRKYACAAGNGGLDLHIVHIHLAVGDKQCCADAVEAGGVAGGAGTSVFEAGVFDGGGCAFVNMDDVLVAGHGFHIRAVELGVLGDVENGVVAVGFSGASAGAAGGGAGSFAGGESAQGEDHAQRDDQSQGLGCCFHLRSSLVMFDASSIKSESARVKPQMVNKC